MSIRRFILLSCPVIGPSSILCSIHRSFRRPLDQVFHLSFFTPIDPSIRPSMSIDPSLRHPSLLHSLAPPSNSVCGSTPELYNEYHCPNPATTKCACQMSSAGKNTEFCVCKNHGVYSPRSTHTTSSLRYCGCPVVIKDGLLGSLLYALTLLSRWLVSLLLLVIDVLLLLVFVVLFGSITASLQTLDNSRRFDAEAPKNWELKLCIYEVWCLSDETYIF